MSRPLELTSLADSVQLGSLEMRPSEGGLACSKSESAYSVSVVLR